MARAVMFDHYGDADVLTVREVPIPEPAAGQVRLQVRAASVNPIDWKVRSGAYSDGSPLAEPVAVGSDVAGVVDAVGSDVDGIAVGDEMLGAAVGGAYADYALADSAAIVPKPPALPWPVAGSLAVIGTTAYRTLRQLDAHAGQSILVHGASGGVGRFAVQLAKLWGLTVIGTAGPSRLDDLRELGVQAVAYGDGWEGRVRAVLPAPDRQVDLVLDTTGKGMLAGSLRLVESAAQVLTIADPDAAKLGVRFSSGSDADGQADSLQAVVRAVADDGVSVPIAATFPLERAADAHRLSEAGHAGGKIVLLPQERA